jgi:hypothetical protein
MTAAPEQRSWLHRMAFSVESVEARLRPMAWAEAQDWCNFVLLRPDELPSGTLAATGTIRPEAPPGRPPGLDPTGRFEHGTSNRASYRFEVRGGGRALRVKQFCYDLGPPAFGYPSMWLNPARPFVRGGLVGWLGTDFTGRPSASIERDQTMVEVAVLAGTFSADELAVLAAGLHPVDERARPAILATPRAERFYQRRHPDLVITVPMGYWSHRRRPATLRTVALRPDEVPDRLRSWEKPPPDGAYTLDSVLVFGDTERPQEVEWIYRDRSAAQGGLRILTWSYESRVGPYPPRLDRQPCRSQLLEVNDTRVFHAYGDPDVGQHEAVVRAGDLVAMVIARSTPDTDIAWFRALLEAMLDGGRRAGHGR